MKAVGIRRFIAVTRVALEWVHLQHLSPDCASRAFNLILLLRSIPSVSL